MITIKQVKLIMCFEHCFHKDHRDAERLALCDRILAQHAEIKRLRAKIRSDKEWDRKFYEPTERSEG